MSAYVHVDGQNARANDTNTEYEAALRYGEGLLERTKMAPGRRMGHAGGNIFCLDGSADGMAKGHDVTIYAHSERGWKEWWARGGWRMM